MIRNKAIIINSSLYRLHFLSRKIIFNISSLFNKPYILEFLKISPLQQASIIDHKFSQIFSIAQSDNDIKFRKNMEELYGLIQKMPINELNQQKISSYLGNYMLLQGRYDEALKQLSKAWKINQKNTNYCNQISLCFIEKSNFFDAIKLLQREASKNIKNQIVYHNLALAYFHTENYHEVVINFYKCYQINNKIDQKFINKGKQLLKEQKYQEALPFFLKMFIYEPNDENILKGLKDGFLHNNNIETGKQIYLHLKTIQEYQQAVQHSLALLYFEIGNIEQSKLHLLSIISKKPDNFQLNLYLATLFLHEGIFQFAFKHYQKCLMSEPNNSMVLSSIADVCMKLKNIEAAISFYKKSLKINSSDSMAWYGLGIIYIQKGDIKQGIEHLQKAIELDEQNYPAIFQLGNVLYLLGEEQKGRKMIEKAEVIKKSLMQQ